MCWINWIIHLTTGKSIILALEIVQGLRKRNLPFGVDSTTIGSPPLPVPTHTPVVENLQLKLPISRSLPRHNCQQIHILFNNKSFSRFLHKLHKYGDNLHPQWRNLQLYQYHSTSIICKCSLFIIHPVTELSNFKSCNNLSSLNTWLFGDLEIAYEELEGREHDAMFAQKITELCEASAIAWSVWRQHWQLLPPGQACSTPDTAGKSS